MPRTFGKEMIRILTVLMALALLPCEGKESVIKVTPGKPRETFLIGSTTERRGETISFRITIAPRTTKPTWPFDCSVKTGAGIVGWHIEKPCYDEAEDNSTTEVIQISIPEAQLESAVFEFRYRIGQTATTEIWQIRLADYVRGAEPE